MTRRISIAIAALLLIAASAFAQSADPCASAAVPKQTKAVNISTATTTELVAAATGETVYLCQFVATVAGTSPTLLFETGTKVSTACDTGAVSLSGTLAITSGTFVTLGYGSTLTAGAASGELCVTSGGTLPSVQGVISYVQR